MTDCSLIEFIFSSANRKYSSAFSYLHTVTSTVTKIIIIIIIIIIIPRVLKIKK